MTKKQKIDEIFRILVEFESINKPELNTTEETYLAHLDRLYTYYLGSDKEDICVFLKGLYKQGIQASHSTVKRTVFHIINLLEMEV